jgi:hypothetical protein
MNKHIIAIASIVSSFAFANAAEIKAPNGGRIIESVTPHAEFLVTADKKVEIRFLDDAGKVVAPDTQIVTVIMGDRSAPTKLAFTKDGDKLVSDKPVAEGKSLPVVLQIRAKEGDKAVTEKFSLNMANCSECSHLEYACTCDHH